MNEFFTILTNVGLARLANATATGTTVTLASIRLGDGGGAPYNPTQDQTNVRREVWRGNITLSRVVPNNPNWIEVEIDVPADVGGFMVREAGLFDSTGAMIAIARYPETFKPQVDSGSAKELKVRMIIQVSNASSVTLQIDPSVVLVSQMQLDDTLNNAGFGANNLIQNAQVPIIINRAGNLTNSTTIIYPNIVVNETYTFRTKADWLQGGTENVMIRLFQSPSATGVTGGTTLVPLLTPIVDGYLEITFDVPEPTLQPFVHLVASAGDEVNSNNLGNTLQISNPMLIKGKRPQLPRRNNLDDFEQIEEIRTLRPNVRRTIGLVNEDGNSTGVNMESTTLLQPNQATTSDQVVHEMMSVINAQRSVNTSTAENAIIQRRFIFNIIEHLTRQYSEAIWQGFTELEDKVRIARQIVSRVACVVDVTGQTNNVPFVNIRVAEDLEVWNAGNSHQNPVVAPLTQQSFPSGANPNRILNDGTCRFLAHTTEGQETPIGGASLTTAFIQFEVDVETTLQPIGYSPSWAEFNAAINPMQTLGATVVSLKLDNLALKNLNTREMRVTDFDFWKQAFTNEWATREQLEMAKELGAITQDEFDEITRVEIEIVPLPLPIDPEEFEGDEEVEIT